MLGARLTSAGHQLPASAQSGRSSGVEHNLAKVGVEGSNPFARSSFASVRGERQLPAAPTNRHAASWTPRPSSPCACCSRSARRFIRASGRRGVGLHRRDGVVLGRARDDEADRARAQPARRRVRHVALLAARPHQLEAGAGVRGDRDAGRVHRRRGPFARHLLQAAGRDPAVGGGGAAAVAAEGSWPSATTKAPSLVDQPARRRGSRPARRPDRHWRRHFPQPADHPQCLGGAAPDVGRGRGLHLPEFDRRACRERRVGRATAARAADVPRGRRRRERCSGPGSESSGCRGPGCCERSALC